MALYLEYSEEDLIMVPSESFINEDDDDDDEDYGGSEDAFDDITAPDMKREQYIAFIPTAVYRNPIQGAKELEVDFDTANLDRIHLVVVRYSDSDEKTEYSGKWHIEKVCPT